MKRKKWLALGLTAALVMSPVTGVYAQESDDLYETVESGDYDSNKKSDAKDEVAVQAAENSNIAASGEGITGETGKNTTVTGNVTTTGEAVDGVTADGKNTTVTVKGNVTVSGTGSAGVSADNNATVEVTGNVQAKGDNQTHEGQTGGTYIDKWADGVQADNGSKVAVDGNVTSENGKGIVFISHKLGEIIEIGDRVSVLKDGAYVGTRDVKDVTADDLVTMMVGRKIQNTYQHEDAPDTYENTEVIFEVRNLSRKDQKVKNVSFKLHKGEILGFSGLVGSGRSEMMNAIFGSEPRSAGDIFIHGKQVKINSPYSAIKNGLAMVTENRRETGFFYNFDITFNNRFSFSSKSFFNVFN